MIDWILTLIQSIITYALSWLTWLGLWDTSSKNVSEEVHVGDSPLAAPLATPLAAPLVAPLASIDALVTAPVEAVAQLLVPSNE